MVIELPPNLPVGVRFHPTDQELITRYLRPKILGHHFDDAIAEIDFCKWEPWELPRTFMLCSKDMIHLMFYYRPFFVFCFFFTMVFFFFFLVYKISRRSSPMTGCGGSCAGWNISTRTAGGPRGRRRRGSGKALDKKGQSRTKIIRLVLERRGLWCFTLVPLLARGLTGLCRSIIFSPILCFLMRYLL